MPTVSPALELGIQTLAEVIQLTPASPALAIIRTSQSILQMINADKSGNRDEQRLALKILDVAVAYSDGLKKFDESAHKDMEIERSLIIYPSRCLESISKEIQNRPKAGFLARLLSHSSRQQRVKAWETDLEQISLLFEMQIQLRPAKMSRAILFESDKDFSQAAMAERINQANQEALDLIKSEVLKQTRKKLHKSSFGHFPPATSPIFFGRSQQVEHLIESLVTVPAYHAIPGPGGMGKTSVGLNVLHDPRIIEVYGKHRYFLACETTVDASGIIAGLSDIFSLNESAFVKLFRGLCEAIDANMLFLLDNFETPWERQETRQNVEDLLTDLSSIPNLSIVITLRGAERPSGIRWSRPVLPVLGPLELSSARQIFMTISDTKSGDADMDTLLAEVEFIPLALTLLAAQAQYTTCTLLLEQWKSNKTAMITRGWDSRLSSLDVSISLSLTSCRFTSNPQALIPLQVLSMLPDGATVDELRDMTEDDIDIRKAVSTLLQNTLAKTGLHDRLRVLAPIREHVHSRHPISHTLLQHVLSYHARLCRYAMSEAFTTEAMTVDDMLRACIGNILYVMQFCLDVEPMTNEAIDATLNVARFWRHGYSASISQLLEQSTKIARAHQQFIPLAECLNGMSIRMCDIGSLGDWTTALRYSADAIDILRRQSSPEGSNLLISALLSQSWMMERLDRCTDALQIAQDAVSLISPSTLETISALAYLRLGECLDLTRNYSESLKALEQAGLHIQSISSPVLGFQLSMSLSRLYFTRDMYRQSINVADKGLSRHTRSDSARAHLLIRQAQIRILVCRYEDGRSYLREAIQCMAPSGSPTYMHSAYGFIGVSYLACGNFVDAAVSFYTARQFVPTDRIGPTVQPRTPLAVLALFQNHLDQSLVHLTSASKEVSICSPISIAGFFWFQTQCQVQIRQREGEGPVSAMSSCVLAAIIAHGIQDKGCIALSILWLGDAFFFVHRDVYASKVCYQAFLDVVRYIGNRRWLASALLRIGVTDYLRGDISLAERRLKQATKFYEETNGKPWVEFSKEMLYLMGSAVQHVS